MPSTFCNNNIGHLISIKAKIIVLIILLFNTYPAQLITWERTNGPYGGCMNDAAVGSNGDVFASASYAIYKSSNNGANWTAINLKTESSIFNMSTSSQGRLFVVDGGSNVYQSDDFGNKWDRTFQLPGGATNIFINNNEKLYCYNNRNLYSSSNLGTTWENIFTLDTSYITDFHIADNSNCFLTTEHQVYYSYDKGLNWEEATNNFTLSAIIAIRGSAEGKIFVSSGNGTYCSSDSGKNWNLILPYYGSLEIDKSDNLWVYNRYAIYKIDNKGTKWTQVSNIERTFSYKLIFVSDSLIFLPTPKGMYVSQDDGFSWLPSNEGITGLNINRPVITKQGSLYFYSQYEIFRTSDNGNSWKGIEIPENSSEFFNYAVDDDEAIYVAVQRGICVSSDVGTSWTRKNLSETAWGMTVYDNKFYAATRNELLNSSDKGNTWESFLLGDNVCCPGKILISRGNIYIARPGHLLKSADGGKTWIKVVTADMGDLVISRLGSIIFTSPQGLYKSTDQGATWTVKQIVADNNPSEISSLKDGHIYVTMANGDLYFSTDDGDSWKLFDTYENLKFRVTGLITDSKGYLFSGSFQHGVYRSTSPFLRILPPSPVLKPGNQEVLISWNRNDSPDFVKYNIYGTQDQYPSTLIKSITDVNDTSFTITGLINNVPFNIVVSAVDNQGNESYSDEISGTPVPPPSTPLLISVDNESKNVSTDLVLCWNKCPFANTYQFQLSTDSLFNSLLFNDSTLTDTSKQVSGLNNLTKYFWRVRATGISGKSNWSGIWSFTTVIAVPVPPLLVMPLNNSDKQAITQKFSWKKSLRAERYHLQISKQENFSKLVINDSTLSDTLINVLLENSTKYFWRLCAVNAGGLSEWSDVWMFTTIVAMPDIPALTSPESNSTDQQTNLKLTWNKAPNAANYYIQVSSDSSFIYLIIADSNIVNTEKQITGLLTGKKYFWRVKALNAAGVSSYSPIWNFITILYVPDGLKAENISTRKIKLSWTDNTNNESGFILERKNENQAGFILIDSLDANTVEYIDSSVIGGQNYRYRVKAFTEFASSSYSNEVIISPLTSVRGNLEIPVDYALAQNYPNPFNPNTMIKFSIPVESRVKVSVYNSLGEIIKELSNEIYPPGYHQLSFDASSLCSGIYLYTINAVSTDGTKNFNAVRKMMLMK